MCEVFKNVHQEPLKVVLQIDFEKRCMCILIPEIENKRAEWIRDDSAFVKVVSECFKNEWIRLIRAHSSHQSGCSHIPRPGDLRLRNLLRVQFRLGFFNEDSTLSGVCTKLLSDVACIVNCQLTRTCWRAVHTATSSTCCSSSTEHTHRTQIILYCYIQHLHFRNRLTKRSDLWFTTASAAARREFSWYCADKYIFVARSLEPRTCEIYALNSPQIR